MRVDTFCDIVQAYCPLLAMSYTRVKEAVIAINVRALLMPHWLLLPVMELIVEHAHSASATHCLHSCTASRVHARLVLHVPSSS